jgi:hypothetical protein
MDVRRENPVNPVSTCPSRSCTVRCTMPHDVRTVPCTALQAACTVHLDVARHVAWRAASDGHGIGKARHKESARTTQRCANMRAEWQSACQDSCSLWCAARRDVGTGGGRIGQYTGGPLSLRATERPITLVSAILTLPRSTVTAASRTLTPTRGLHFAWRGIETSLCALWERYTGGKAAACAIPLTSWGHPSTREGTGVGQSLVRCT